LATLGDPAANRLVQDARADAAVDRPLARSDVLRLLEKVVLNAPLTDDAQRARVDLDDYAIFPGLRVLVADDAAVNREVAIEALSRLQAVVETAENGAQAIEAVRSRDFDVVLMDASMPEMDGFEATRRIRSRELETGGPRLPIVALTAHVIGAAAEAWREAGMDAVLHKPYTIKDLSECFWKVARVSARQPSSPVAAAPAPLDALAPSALRGMAEEPLLDSEILTRLKGMSAAGGDGFMSRVFNLYLEHAPKAAEAMKSCLDANDIAGIGRAAHALKSMSLNMGARRVSSLCTVLERRAIENAASVTRGEVDELAATLCKTLAALKGDLLATDGLPTTEAASAVVTTRA